MAQAEGGDPPAAGPAIEEWAMGGGSILRLLVDAERSEGSVTVIEGFVQEGGPPLHVHDAEDEVVVVLEGELAYRIGDERGSAGEGGLLWLSRGIPHTLANLSGRPCRFLTLATPRGIEELFRAQSEYIASLPAGTAPALDEMERLPGAASRRAVGPPLAFEEP